MLNFLQNRGRLNFIHMEIKSQSFVVLLANVFSVFKVCYTRKPDIVLSEGGGIRALIGLAGSKIGRSSFVFRVKGDPFLQLRVNRKNENPLQRMERYINYYAGRITIRYSDMVLPISSIILDILQKSIKYKKQMRVIPIPVRKIDRTIRSDKIDKKNFVITVSSYQFFKKAEPLLLAINPVSRVLRSLDFSWYILGDGKYMPNINREIIRANAGDIVKTTGRVDPVPYYKKARAHLYFSGMDAFPNAILESFYHQIPVVVNSDMPAKDIAIKDLNVLVLKNYDVNSIDTVIKRILFDSKLRSNLISSSNEFIKDSFSVENLSGMLWDAFVTIRVAK